MNISKMGRFISPLALAIAVAVSGPAAQAWAQKNVDDNARGKVNAAKGDATKPPALVDINTATEAELEQVNGIGPAYAKKIVAHRPYASVAELSKTGIPANRLTKIEPLVTVTVKAAAVKTKGPTATESASKVADKAKEAGTKGADKSGDKIAVKPAGLVDINTATEAELEQVNGVGSAYAKKIIDHRPYVTVKELSKTGIAAGVLAKIEPLVTASQPTATTEKTADSSTDKSAEKTTKSTKGTMEARTPPKKGMVWVNKSSKIYHVEGDTWYGRTKSGDWMSEEDAIKAGYRRAK